MLLRSAAIGLALALVSGCGSTATHTPARGAANAYVVALRSEDPRPAYELLSDRERAATSFDEFAAQWKDSQVEREQRATAIEAALSSTEAMAEEAELQYADDARVHLRYAGKRWALDAPFADALGARSPHDAALDLLDHLDGPGLASLIDLLSNQRRTAITQQLEVFRSSLREHLKASPNETYQVSDTRAEIRWSYENTIFRLSFVREGQEWKIDDIHLGPDPVQSEEASSEEEEQDGPRRPIERPRF
jgi:hypothetical protein